MGHKIGYLSGRAIVEILNFGSGSNRPFFISVPTVKGLPKGTTVVSSFACPERRSIGLILGHESFPDTPDGRALDDIEGVLACRNVDVFQCEEATKEENARLAVENAQLLREVSDLQLKLAKMHERVGTSGVGWGQ